MLQPASSQALPYVSHCVPAVVSHGETLRFAQGDKGSGGDAVVSHEETLRYAQGDNVRKQRRHQRYQE
jgi:hypothetical protein